jgi:tRNA A-37 threonylcarbamoyl transferase component Bud32
VRPGDPSHLLGKVIDGRYEILQCIGEGGMGVVYKARQTSIDRMVAVKMLSSHLAKDRAWVQRFYNEAKACSRLHHPNTIRMFDFGQTREGQLFMAMEFLDGLSLRQVIGEQAPIDPQRALKVVIQCCASLSEAHNLGIIHRDIKADNVYLIDLPGSRDHVKLLDFGVAKLMMAEEFATQVGVVFGTPQYMSPEQGRGEPLTPRSDLYGVGILGYEMLTGTVPFSDQVPMNVLQMHLQSPVPPLPPRVPAAVQQVIMRALEKDPGRRYATAAAMMEEAQSVLSTLQNGAFRQSGSGAAVGTPDAFPSVPGDAASGATIVPGAINRFAPSGGPPPPVMQHQPNMGPPNMAGANMPTVLDRPNPLLAQSGDRPQVSPSSLAAAAARTVMVGAPGQMARPDGPQPGPNRPAFPPVVQGEPRTMMLANSEGIVSMGRDSRPMQVPDGRGPMNGPMGPMNGPMGGPMNGPMGGMNGPMGGPMGGPMVGYGTSTGAGASALFWILCLLTGLAVGIGAYWLVLELGQ